MRRTWPLLAQWIALASLASAQQALFLVPEQGSVALGRAVPMSAVSGAGRDAAPLPWPEDRISHFYARTAWTQENRDTIEPEEGSPSVAAWTADRPGVLALGADLRERPEVVSAAAFGEFVSGALGESARASLGALPERGEVTLLRTESAKALVVVAQPGAGAASIATSKTGQAVEIRPLMDPTALIPGSDLAVRVYSRLGEATGGLVLATNATTGETVRAVADDSGIAILRIGGAGRWRLEFHAVAAHPGAGDARYALHTATLTFDVEEDR